MSETIAELSETAGGEAAEMPAKVEQDDTLIVIERTAKWAVIDGRQLWHYRDLLQALALRDLKVRYKQTALGVAWVVLQPLVAAGIFGFVFGVVAGLKSQGIPYFVFSFAGLLGWNLFSNTLTRVSICLLGNAPLISKVYFPRLILPLSTLGGVLVDFAVGAALMVVLLAIYRIVPGWSLLALPIWMAMLLMTSLGAGLWAAALTVSYRDVQYIMPMVTQLALYATPVAYAAEAVPAAWRPVLYLNPMAGMLEGFRWSLLGTAAPSLGAVAWAGGASLLMLLGGAAVFKQMERKFADVI